MRLRSSLPHCLWLVVCAVLPGSHGAAAQTPPQPVAPQHAVLVELFTSEGCSSCPPADALLRQINGKHTDGGQLIVGLSEHVTYWNRLGWTDPFSAETFTNRQNQYAQRLRLDDVYTPQMVVNGHEQLVGGNGPALRDAFHQELQSPSIPIDILSIQPAAQALTVRFHVGTPSNSQPLDIIAVVADDADHTAVTRGENAGHTLQHVAVARSLMRVATVHGAGEQQVLIPLAPGGSNGASGKQHLVLFAQEPGSGRVFGSVMQALP